MLDTWIHRKGEPRSSREAPHHSLPCRSPPVVDSALHMWLQCKPLPPARISLAVLLGRQKPRGDTTGETRTQDYRRLLPGFADSSASARACDANKQSISSLHKTFRGDILWIKTIRAYGYPGVSGFYGAHADVSLLASMDNWTSFIYPLER